jgi:3',5'-cyclic AMP phosphodiesterase CpdA
MPFIVDRRSFLKSSLGAIALSAAGRRIASAADANSAARWALLSDIHIAADPADTYRGFRPSANLTRVLGQVSETQFDGLLVNGDLARLLGKPDDYARVAGYLEPLAQKMPLAITLGNHDSRKNTRAAIVKMAGATQPVERKLVTTVDAGPVQLILLDSLLATNVTPGQLGTPQRNWLASYIGTLGSKPAVIFVHHNLDPKDDNALVDAAALLDIAKSARAVKAILYGHTHAWKYAKSDELHLVNIPAVGYNFKDSEPVGWTEAVFRPDGCTLKLHAIGGEMAPDGQVLQLRWS